MDLIRYFASLTLITFTFGHPSPLKDFSHESHQIFVDSFNTPISCYVKEFNFTATVTDRNGKQCRGKVTTKACFGSCESSEVIFKIDLKNRFHEIIDFYCRRERSDFRGSSGYSRFAITAKW